MSHLLPANAYLSGRGSLDNERGFRENRFVNGAPGEKMKASERGLSPLPRAPDSRKPNSETKPLSSVGNMTARWTKPTDETSQWGVGRVLSIPRPALFLVSLVSVLSLPSDCPATPSRG